LRQTATVKDGCRHPFAAHLRGDGSGESRHGSCRSQLCQNVARVGIPRPVLRIPRTTVHTCRSQRPGGANQRRPSREIHERHIGLLYA
jgi:hypothetical protein